MMFDVEKEFQATKEELRGEIREVENSVLEEV